VHRHVRGKWVCRRCEKLIQKPVPPHVIDKGIRLRGLLAQVLVAKYAEHQPLYRQAEIFERAGVAIARSTLAQWVGACGVGLEPLALVLKRRCWPDKSCTRMKLRYRCSNPELGRTHRAYLWSYSTTQYDPMAAVVYDFADSRSGHHARSFPRRLVW